MDNLQIFLSACAGIGLSAACGFRVFVPLLCLSIGAMTGHVHLASSFSWIGTTPALIAFSVATALEIVGYYVPYVDNVLDTVAGPTAVIAGIIVTASMITDMSPFWRWTLAMIAGGGAAATTQLTTTKLRASSSVATAGLGNPILSTIELALSSVLSALAVIWPFVAFLAVLIVVALCWLLIWMIGKRLLKFFRKSPAAA